jgi:hypothetical protein
MKRLLILAGFITLLPTANIWIYSFLVMLFTILDFYCFRYAVMTYEEWRTVC